LPINGWCSTCDHGLVAGLIISSQQFHELLDAHGHDVEIATLQCGMCRIVAPEDEFCSRCRNGFVAGQLYFSELTWALARGVSEASGGRCSGYQTLIGTVGHDVVTWEGRKIGTFQLAMAWMLAGDIRTDLLLTHRFPLDEYRRAFAVATTEKARERSVKVAFTFND
jgi:hypothetical protein